MIKNREVINKKEISLDVINSKPSMTLIVNPKTLEIVYFNELAKNALVDIKLNDKCYKALYDREEKCIECPLLDLMNPFVNIDDKEENNIIKKYIDKMDQWNNIIYKKMLMPDNEVYVLINSNEVEDIHKNILLRKQNEEKVIRQVFDDVLNKGALYEDSFEVNYQPIYDLEKSKFTKFEALIRMYDKDKNYILPLNFISLAEELGLINQISYFVLEDLCKTIKELIEKEISFEAISMNISAVQLIDKSFCKNIINIINKYNIGLGLIDFEITEDKLLPVKDEVYENMNELMNKGIRFSIDDFGRGNSNLTYLLDFNIDVVKIDRYFIRDAEDNLKKKMFLKNIVNLFTNLDKEIIVEGVETKDQLEIVRKTNCKKVQGFYFSKPLSKIDLYKFLDEN